ncbi:hypothetical protein CEE96_12525, partial [Lactobacillus crispatus]
SRQIRRFFAGFAAAASRPQGFRNRANGRYASAWGRQGRLRRLPKREVDPRMRVIRLWTAVGAGMRRPEGGP